MAYLLMVLCCQTGFGQNAGLARSKFSPKVNKDGVITDIFKGMISEKNKAYATELSLQHKPYYDMGSFALTITPAESVNNQSLVAQGEWTVLKGSAKDENAVVVEIDTKGKTLYFLRLKNGNLEQLDSTLHEMKPVRKYVLQKQNK